MTSKPHRDCAKRVATGRTLRPALLLVASALFWGGYAHAAEDRAGADSSEENDGAGENTKSAGEGSSIMPQLTVPRFELPGSKLPEVEGLRRPTTEREEMPERAQPVDVGFSVLSIHHARSHRGSARGCVPQNRIEGFRAQEFPTLIQPFTSCIRFTAERAVVARFQAQILDPGGSEVADADGEISFAGGGKTIDYVISWAGFPARAAGTYEIVLTLERREVGRFPLEVALQ